LQRHGSGAETFQPRRSGTAFSRPSRLARRPRVSRAEGSELQAGAMRPAPRRRHYSCKWASGKISRPRTGEAVALDHPTCAAASCITGRGRETFRSRAGPDGSHPSASPRSRRGRLAPPRAGERGLSTADQGPNTSPIQTPAPFSRSISGWEGRAPPWCRNRLFSPRSAVAVAKAGAAEGAVSPGDRICPARAHSGCRRVGVSSGTPGSARTADDAFLAEAQCFRDDRIRILRIRRQRATVPPLPRCAFCAFGPASGACHRPDRHVSSFPAPKQAVGPLSSLAPVSVRGRHGGRSSAPMHSGRRMAAGAREGCGAARGARRCTSRRFAGVRSGRARRSQARLARIRRPWRPSRTRPSRCVHPRKPTGAPKRLPSCWR